MEVCGPTEPRIAYQSTFKSLFKRLYVLADKFSDGGPITEDIDLLLQLVPSMAWDKPCPDEPVGNCKQPSAFQISKRD